MKEFVLPAAEDDDQRISKFLMCDTQLKYKILVSLGYLLLGHPFFSFFKKIGIHSMQC